MRSPNAGTRSSGQSCAGAAAGSGGICVLPVRPRRAARRFQPDVVYAHFLVPTGLSAALFTRAPLVVTAHGRDVRNIGAYPGIAAATRFVARRASTLIAVSDYLRRELETKIVEARGKTEVVDCGVDLDLFTESDPVQGAANGPVFVCVGSLIERKNVVRLADAFATLDAGRLVFVGDGPLRSKLEGRPNVEVTGRVPHDEVPRYLAEATVLCQPSTVEPFGQALLEAMAAGRSVVGTLGRRAARVRAARRRRSRRPSRHGRPRGCDASRGHAPETEPGGPGCRGRARRQASGGEDRVDPGESRSRSASLTSTSGRTLSSSPASRATTSACS